MVGRLVLLLGMASAVGCAEPIQLLARAPASGPSPCSFWPPAPSTETWIAKPDANRHPPMNSVAGSLELSLRAAGYSDQRWFPIGARHEHGFAVTTRLERVDDDLLPDTPRWTSLYREAANLKWLRLARTLPLPRSGGYRVFLIAYTDLPIGPTSFASTWSDATMMDGPGAKESFSARESEVPTAPTPVGYRFGIYEYQYHWQDSEARVALRAANEAASETPQPPARLDRVVRRASADQQENETF